MKDKKYYTQTELEDYVRKLLTDSEITLSKQAERIEQEKKENARLLKELEEYKKKEKSIARLLLLSERKAKFLETTTRSKCAIEIERLARLVDKWESFFKELNDKYSYEEEEKLLEFKDELQETIDNMLEMGDLLSEKPLEDSEKEHISELNRLEVVKNKKQNEIDERFSKLVLEFNMKIGDNATRGRGRPKKGEITNIKVVEDKFDKKEKNKKKTVYPPVGENGFDFNEALNPTDSLEDIMRDLIGEIDD